MDSLDKEIGPKQAIQASTTMVVTDVIARMVDSIGGKEILEVMGQIPNGNTLNVSKAKVRQGAKLLVKGLWVSDDKDGRLHSLSTLAVVLRFYKAKTPRELVGKQVQMVLDDVFMVIKAY